MPQKRRNLDFINNFSNSPDIERSKEIAMRSQSSKYEVTNVSLSKIILNEMNSVFNANDTDEEIIELADGMKTPQDLRTPIRLNRLPNGQLKLVSGERRTRAFMYNREKVLRENPAVKTTPWDTIPAFIETMSEAEATLNFFLDNLETRTLTAKQKFLCYEQMITRLEEDLGREISPQEKSKIADRIKISKKSAQRLRKLHDNASKDDIALLREGKITFEEFKSRTNAFIKAQSKATEERNAILSQRAIPKSYYDKDNDSVYYIGQTSDPLTNAITYCTFTINKYMNSPIHVFGLGEYSVKSLAQVDLDRYASNNLLAEYKGDFTEYTVNQSKTELEDKKNQSEKTPSQESASENTQGEFDIPKTEYETETKSDENANFSENTEETDETKTQVSETGENEFVDEKISAESSHDESIEANEQAEVAHSVSENTTDDSDTSTNKRAPLFPVNDTAVVETKGEISHFTGINLHGMSVQGSLLATPNGRVYIVSNFEFGKNIGDGKFEMKCTAEEVDRDSVRRIDDI